ncbi:hypothetical protein F0L68_31270 [Solihabitans fulvus]|uniref:YbaB/EbfC DNA-binding family protein n=1 Tax=Solihabitans fulvus TaxID=1892852 RepID=A0A5B2WQ48_9PSEU|nr:YbaB/EbfC family nucleoid-associated protein [Solihabitans fulvus]KAA2254093.1 hypothetical protein F0L68_31270 [Solihabitans fulvus]
MNDRPTPSLDELAATSERANRGLLHQRRQLDEQVIVARDDWCLVEVGVNGHGEIVEVSVNERLLGQVTAQDLAQSVLQAARAAQQQVPSARSRPGGRDTEVRR